MDAKLLSEIRAKAQARIAANIYEDADASCKQLSEVGEKIKENIKRAWNVEVGIVVGPIKKEQRAREKVTNDYGGDWYDLKDVVRLTIIAPDLRTLEAVQAEIRRVCVANQGLGLMKDFEATPENSACGYSGLNFVVRLRNGRPGEIQANVPQVMYGQMSMETFCATLGSSLYDSIKAQYQIEGGLGHGLYEIYRAAPASPNAIEARALSREYFNYLREKADGPSARILQTKIVSYKKRNADMFH